MSWLQTLIFRVTALFRRRRLEDEMAEEMRQHLEFRIQEHLTSGVALEEARYAAQREFGGLTQMQEQCRDERRFVWLEQLSQDLRFAARSLRKNPGFTFVSVLTLGFGIGVNTSMFTALQSALMREIPCPDPDRVVELFRTSPRSQRGVHSAANFLDQQAENGVFERMAAVSRKSFSLSDSSQPAELISAALVSVDLFPLIGVQPALGRVFTAQEDRQGNSNVVVLDYGFWLRRFGGDPNILGRTLRLDGETVTVVGVMPSSFRDIPLVGQRDVWRPIAFTDVQRENRAGNYLESIARLKPGVSLAQAQAAIDILAAKQAADHPENNSEMGLRLMRLSDAVDPQGKMWLWLTSALAGFVLLIACANLANLQFARTGRRTHELAIRGALGASRSRLLRQLLAESLLLAFLGGLLGLVLANWGNQLLSRLIVSGNETVVTLNVGVLGFALIASTVSGFAFGLVPAWLASRANTNDAMKQGSRGSVGSRSRNRLQYALIVAEVALALTLLAAAGLMVRGLQRFTSQNPGWEIDGLTVGSVGLPQSKYDGAGPQGAFAERLRSKLAALPGVESVAIASSLPTRSFNVTTSLTIDGRPEPKPGHEPICFVNAVTPGYFATFKMRIVAGRDFNAADIFGGHEVAIINETMARTFWPGESPINKSLNGEEVVGVVSDVRFPSDVGEPSTRFQTYRPFAQMPVGSLAIALRGNVTVGLFRRAVAELDADLVVNDLGAARAAVERLLANFGRIGWILSGFGVLGLLLASLGIYGVIAGFVVQRTNEIGVRMALGAQLRDVLWLVIGKGLRLTMLGVAIGLIGAFCISRLLASIAPGLDANDPLAIGLVAVLLVGVAVLACWLPARRAMRIDPIAALRSE